jgi:hypothetical protein
MSTTQNKSNNNTPITPTPQKLKTQLTKKSNNISTNSRNILTDKKTEQVKKEMGNGIKYKTRLLDFDYEKLKGIYPVMLNVNKIMSILKSKNIKVTSKNSFRLLGEYVNRYNKIDETFEEKIESHKEFLQLNNNYETIIETIQLFSKSGTITPKTFIDTINNLILFYDEPNKQEILLHYAYLAEVVYKHFSIMKTNEELDRNDFFSSEIELDKVAVRECAEFYYTDIYLLNSDEKAEMMKNLKSYYLEEVSAIKAEENKIVKAEENSAKQLEVETNAEKKRIADELAAKKAEKEKNNSKLTRSIQDMREYRLRQEEKKERNEKERKERLRRRQKALKEAEIRRRKLAERRARYGY